jgi:glycosyltransferase involved in cell wall biosynthesis
LIHNPALYDVRKEQNKIVIGWTGSHSTLKYLYLLKDVLKRTMERFSNVYLLIIADKVPELDLERVIFKPWSKESEIKDLLLSDIGIMPLPDDEWSKGKCGFKALQYMALEIPAIASPIGVNTQIIQHGQNGYLCSTEKEWLAALEQLIKNMNQRRQLGQAGRKTVVERYSVSSNTENFLSLFK